MTKYLPIPKIVGSTKRSYHLKKLSIALGTPYIIILTQDILFNISVVLVVVS